MATTRALEDFEIKALFDVIDGRYAFRDRTMVLVGIHMALRASEICGLTIGDVSAGGNIRTYVTVRPEIAKRGKERTIRMGREINTAIADFIGWKAQRNEPLDAFAPLFVSQKGGHVSRITLFNVVKRLMVGVGISQSPHALRKTGATIFYEQSGCDLIATQEFLGHADPSVTRRYIGITARQRAEYAQRASQALVDAIAGDVPKRNSSDNMFRFPPSIGSVHTDTLVMELQRRGFDAASLIAQMREPNLQTPQPVADNDKIVTLDTRRKTSTRGGDVAGRS